MPGVEHSIGFIDALRRSGLVEAARLNAYLFADQEPDLNSTSEIAEKLVADGLLTRFQVERLLQGKWRGFTVAGKYRLLESIGAGGMGSVFLAEHLRMHAPVAIKFLSPDVIGGSANLQRLEREARAAATITHPNLVRAFDIDESDGLHYIVMEFVHGVSFQKLGECSSLLVSRAVEYVRQAALGLHHAHAAGLVHRDVKPGNLLVGANGVVRVLDLGLARFFRDRHDRLTDEQNRDSILGTADYLSPEQAIDSSGVDARTDLYSLGATLYFLLTGRPPFDGGTTAEKLIRHQTREPAALRTLRPDVPKDLDEFVRRMMAKEPDDRPQSAADVADMLVAWVTEPVPSPTAEELPDFCPAVRKLLPISTPEPPSGTGQYASTPRVFRPSVGRRLFVLIGIVIAAGIAVAATNRATWKWFPEFEPLPPVDRETLPNPFQGMDPARVLNADAAFGHTGERRKVRFYVRGRARATDTGAIHLYSRSSPADLKNFTAVIGPAAEATLKAAGMKSPYDELYAVTIEVSGPIAYLRNEPGRPSVEVMGPETIRVVPGAERVQ